MNDKPKPTNADTRTDIASVVDALMAARPAERPAITVVGDDSVFAISPPRRDR